MKIKTRIVAVNVVIAAVALSSLAVMCMYTFKQELEAQAVVSQEARLRTFWQLIHQEGKELRLENGLLMAGSHVLNGDNDLPDTLGRLCGGEATIFMNDTRIATNILKEDGSRAVGTKLTGAVYDTVIRDGKPSRGEATVLGTPYFTAYDPIKNGRGETIGVLATAVKKSDYLASYDRLLILVPALALAFLAAAACVTVVIVHRLFAPLNRMHDTLVAAEATGDLSLRISYEERNEVGEMCHAFNTFMEKFHTIVTRIHATSRQLAAAAGALNGAYGTMVANANDVAAQAAAVAVASEEMTATSHNVSSSCSCAAQSSEQASGSAQTGAGVVRETVSVMNLIAERVRNSALSVDALVAKSDQIGAIVSTIEDIADQTNLLALNAAIEAARAGEQGRGFAVVADEVRALAERTTRATREIGDMIGAIQKETKGAVQSMEEGVNEVERGTQEAAKSGEALQDILNQIQDVSLQVTQIATAAEQQSATSNDISGNIHTITGMMQVTVEVVTESARTATGLAALSDDLQHLVDQFRIA